MKTTEKSQPHFIVEKLIKIMKDRGLTKVDFSDLIGFTEPKWNKISNGIQKLSINELSIIAEKLQMREIDIITYPNTFVEKDKNDNDVKAQLTVELKEELRDKVLAMIFGNNNIELLK
ncbi:MAG: helix-turn-helix transcriptional regulator [Paludibacteraceae bacterium]|jgi:transcriptional regulator with XRE-family HTH domain|nr:helix-turn-helix transcriptional regulator [Paludibacteraceae bacterium]